MPEIAYTTIGRNTLFTGLISHITAFLVGTLSVSGTEHLFSIVFSFSCIAFVIGAYVELKYRGRYPLRDWRFYVTAAVIVLPLIGPFIAFGMLYSFPKSEQGKSAKIYGFFPAFFRLKANILVIFLLIIFLLILFVFTSSQDEPYYKKRYRNYQNKNVSQSSLSLPSHLKWRESEAIVNLQ